MLKELKVKSIRTNVKGFRMRKSVEDNWFGSEINETDSVVFYAFYFTKNLDALIETINTLIKIKNPYQSSF